jgi:glutaredoxin
LKEVVLYTREACSLCKSARAVILGVQREMNFVFREVDIDGDPELFEEHKHDIPVIEIDGRRAFKYRVDPDALRRMLSP